VAPPRTSKFLVKSCGMKVAYTRNGFTVTLPPVMA
jgi:hypothetical protein